MNTRVNEWIRGVASEWNSSGITFCLACCCCCCCFFFSPFPLHLGVPRGARACLSPVNEYRTTDRLTVILAYPHVSPIYFSDTLLPRCNSVPTRNYAIRRFFLFQSSARCYHLAETSIQQTCFVQRIDKFSIIFVQVLSRATVYISVLPSPSREQSKLSIVSALFAFCFTFVSFVPPKCAPLQCKLR